EDREEALRRLALLDWRIRGDFPAAFAKLGTAEAIGFAPFKNAAALARAKRASGDFIAARAAAQKAIATAGTEGEREAADIELASVALDRLHAVPLARYAASDKREMAEALGALTPWLANPPTSEDVAFAAFALALRLGDGPTALAAWRSF